MNTAAVDHSCEIRVLGALRAAVAGTAVTLPRSRKARALLAYLAVAGNHGANREDLCRLLFADTNNPRGSLRWGVSRLRAALGDDDKTLLIGADDRLKLTPHCRLDLDRLADLISGQRAALNHSRDAVSELISFEQTIEGGFLDGLELRSSPEFETWRLAWHSRCRELHSGLLWLIIRHLRGERRAIEFARRLVNVDPASESAWAELVALLKRNGHVDEARRTHDLAHRELSREGVPLTGRLREALTPPAAQTAALNLPLPEDGRATVLVLQASGGSDIDDNLVQQVSAGIAVAASRCKACRMRIPILSGAASDAIAGSSDLLLQGRIYRAAVGFEIHADLREASSGESVFSWLLRVRGDEPETLVEQVTRYFSSHFEFDLIIAQIGLARKKPLQQRSPLDQYHLALPLIYSAEGIRTDAALTELAAVLDRAPDLAPVLCATGWVRSVHPDFNSTPEELNITSAMVRKAVEIGQDDPFVLGFAAVVIAHCDLDVATAEDLVLRALELNGESPLALIAGGYTAHYLGNFELSLARIATVDDLDATGPLRFFAYTCRAMSFYQLDRLEEAEDWGRRALGHNPTFIVSLRVLAATLARRGELEEAREIVARMTQLDASETLAFFRQRSPYVSATARERLCADLESAGMPESLPEAREKLEKG